ncbi:S1 family peptidase [Sphingomonas pituitosa]|uniref:S1 family peptidase n=1 Tax=Sphingomonas pituitosa TaxID=99597 RepID=UPI00082BB875|nr:serine protease [Sphingomonas pituitosa]
MIRTLVPILGVCVLSAVGSSAAQHRAPGLSKAIRDAIQFHKSGKYLGEDKIMGGTFAVAGDNPWQVALVVGDTILAPRILFCGGSIVSKDLVITAAHCVDEGTPEQAVDVVVGATKLATEGKRVAVQSIWIDPDYNKGQYRAHDVAVLKLTEDVSALTDPIDIANEADDAALTEGRSVRVTGWGAPGQGAGAVRDLRTVDLMLISTKHCNDPVAYAGAVGSSMICAGWPKGGRNSCQGDSGGPMSSMLGGSRRLVGIVSWGRECELTDKFGVYARVTVLSWARKCAADNSQCKM